MRLDRVTLKNFLKVSDANDFDYYIEILTNLKPRPFIGKYVLKTLGNIGFETVKDLQELLSRPKIDYLSMLVMLPDITVDYLLKQKIVDIFHFYNHLINEIEITIKNENRLLNYIPDPDEIAAGIDRFNKFGIFGTIDSLADGDLLKHKEILKMPYNIVFSKLLYMKEQGMYQKALIKLKYSRNG